MNLCRIAALSGACVVATFPLGAEEDPFAANVRPTDPLTAEEQLQTFDLPEGFVVQLVASEPDINKPMNLAFDAIGRLWVTTSREYPRPAPPDRPGRDRVVVFEDFGPDGRARKVTTFADGLNIPIGIYPFRSPSSAGGEAITWKAIVWSIPHIWLMEDVDGDGRADRREPLYGPFDHTRDTHGNQASFRRGFDGWLYATHGYNNDSHVAGRDGHRVHMNSGNTYRIRMDGGRIEHFTWGQVNPFGMDWDPQGNLYTSDCHSEPIYMLQPGGYYPSFGKPHDGLGFAPSMMEQIRGSTAIDGLSFYADDLWPPEYHDNIFIGDVMTSRVYRDAAIPRGSGRIAQPRPDLVASRDPWFRPVDTRLGPDGALYIADFYNRIIGHYEVPLDHPGRDRERGRIWRVFPGQARLRPPAIAQDLPGLVEELASPNLPRRLLAMNDLADRFGSRAAGAVRRALESPRNPEQRVHLLWLLERMGELSGAELLSAGAADESIVRIHALRMVTERARRLAVTSRSGEAPDLGAEVRALAVRALRDPDPQVRRCATEALGALPALSDMPPLLALRHAVPQDDRHLLYAVRQSLRNHLQRDEILHAVLERRWNPRDLAVLLDVVPAVSSELAARFLMTHLDAYATDRERLGQALLHIARHGGLPEIGRLAELALERAGDDVDFQLSLFNAVRQGLGARGVEPTPKVRAWGAQLAERLLASARASNAWAWEPIEGTPAGANPWDFQERPCADGRPAILLSSHPRGERLTGVLRSPEFRAPAELSFHLAGHDGVPGRPAQGLNFTRLVDAETGEVLATAPVPRSDTAVEVRWDLASHKGRAVRFEAVDGDYGSAFAWLAVGRFGPGAPEWPDVAPAAAVSRQVAAAAIAESLGLENVRDALRAIARDRGADPAARAAAARAVDPDPETRAVAEIVSDAAQPFAWRVLLADARFAERGADFTERVWKDAPYRFQVRYAGVAASSAERTRELVRDMAEGRVPAGLLYDARLRESLRRAADPEARRQIAELVDALPDEDEALGRAIEERREAFARAAADPARGREVFAAACASCHRIGTEGGLVGPQLTGIGTRGVERLCEDILAPNRNVDRAFWTTVLNLKDGETVTGLFRREEGDLLVLANAAGLEFTVPRGEVASREESRVSLMPANYGEALPPEDFNHLLAFLMEQQGAVSADTRADASR